MKTIAGINDSISANEPGTTLLPTGGWRIGVAMSVPGTGFAIEPVEAEPESGHHILHYMPRHNIDISVVRGGDR